MKKLLTLLVIFALSITALASCATPEDTTTVRIGYMQGPTGMGLAKLIHDNGGVAGNEKYTFTKFGDVKEATAALLAGTIDIACLPTNNAASLYNTQGGAVQVLALNCLNSLYVMVKDGVELNTVDDLNGKTVYTISNGTPKGMLEYVIDELDLDVTIETTALIGGNEKDLTQPNDLASALIAGAVDIALVPEPVATAAPLKIASMEKDYTYSVAFPLSDIWSSVSDTPVAMGCFVAKADFIEAHPTLIDAFLSESRASIEFISASANVDTAAEYIVEADVLSAAAAAKKSLTNLGSAISYVDGNEMQTTLDAFFGVLELSLIGGNVPDENFYYKK